MSQGDIVSTLHVDGHIPLTSVASNDNAGSQIFSPVLPTPQAAPIDKSDVILAYLQRLDQSNQALTKHVVELETNRPMVSAPQNAGSRLTAIPAVPNLLKSTVQVQYPVDGGSTAVGSTHGANHLSNPSSGPASSNITAKQGLLQGILQPEAPVNQAQFNADGILPSLSTLRQNQDISQSVNQVLSSYENQARLEATQGKAPRKSRVDLTSKMLLQALLSADGPMKAYPVL